MTSTPDETADTSAPEQVPDPVLVGAHDLAVAALSEITPPSTIGPAADYRLEADGVVSMRFANRLAGYPGWFWTVSLARIEGEEPTVLEVELLPSDGALVAPEWVPWAERLADYHAAQAALSELADDEDADLDANAADDDSDDDDDDDDDDDLDDLDAADFDTDGSPILHAGDVDGVDIDELSPDADDDLDADDSDDDDDDLEDNDDDDDLDEDDDLEDGEEADPSDDEE